MWCWCLFRVSLIWVPLMLWWCLTGKAWFTFPSSSLSSTVCSKGKMWHHNPQCIPHHVLHVFSESFWLSLLMFCVHRKSYRSLGLLWAGSSIAHQIVLIPGVVIGESCLHERFDSSHHLCCLWLFFMWVMFLFLQVNMGLTFDQRFGGMFPSFWCLSGRRTCSSADPERCQSSQQTRSVSAVKTFIFCV